MHSRPEDGTPATPPVAPDPQGQAALLLVESLIHGLIANASLSIGQAVEIIDIAADVKVQVADDGGEDPAVIARSLALLTRMSSSLRLDLGE